MDYDKTEFDHITEAGHDYRLKKITEIQKDLEEQRHKRRELSEKYYKAVKWVNNADAVLIALSMGLGVAGVGLLSTIIVAPVVVGLESVALCTGVLSMVGKYASKKLTLTAQKHEKIAVLAEAKLNSISTLISKALNDENISDQEFSLIVSEFSKFQEMKNDIIIKTREQIRKENNPIERARESLVDKFFKKSEK